MSGGRSLADLVRDGLQTALRLFPWPTPTGLRRAGRPGPDSPVIVTGNYDLTVRRVLRGLAGVDAWVVVAPSGGINVWCAATGGHLGTHQVVTALKTSGVERHVQHRRAILPQLAATGVLPLEVFRRCRWQVRFGPVHAEDLPGYLAAGGEKSDAMRRVRFGLTERLEMASAWAFPTALVAGGAVAIFRPAWGALVAASAALLALAVFLAYERLPEPRRVLFAGAAVVLAVAGGVIARAGADAVAFFAVSTAALAWLLTYDYAGSTPVEGGSHFEERRWHIRLDLERCRGVFRCWAVCPEACFEKHDERRQVELAHDERCVRCGACVVQCPVDALAFEDENGQRVPPETIRRFKLTLLGSRSVPTPGA